MGVADELTRLVALRDSGVITPEEFDQQRAILLAQPTVPTVPTTSDPMATSPGGVGLASEPAPASTKRNVISGRKTLITSIAILGLLVVVGIGMGNRRGAIPGGAAPGAATARQPRPRSRSSLSVRSSDGNRERLGLGELRAAMKDRLQLFHTEPVALGFDEGLSAEELEQIEVHLRQIEARTARLSLGRLRRFPGEKDLARKLSRLNEYLNFRYAHHLAHGSPLAQATRTRYPAKNEVAVFHQNRKVSLLVGVGTFAALTALRAQAAVGTILEFVESDVDALIDEEIAMANAALSDDAPAQLPRQ